MKLADYVGFDRMMALRWWLTPRKRRMSVGRAEPLRWICEACGSASHVRKPTFGTGPSVMYCEHCERATLAHLEGKA